MGYSDPPDRSLVPLASLEAQLAEALLLGWRLFDMWHGPEGQWHVTLTNGRWLGHGQGGSAREAIAEARAHALAEQPKAQAEPPKEWKDLATLKTTEDLGL